MQKIAFNMRQKNLFKSQNFAYETTVSIIQNTDKVMGRDTLFMKGIDNRIESCYEVKACSGLLTIWQWKD